MPRATSSERDAPSTLRIALTALVVAAGYYAGANLGFILRLPPETPSVMWPPNAILTATLLLSSPRRWAIYLLAAFPAHLAAELGLGWPPVLVLLLYVTNCSEALIAALVVRRLSDAPGRFDTLRRVIAFIVGAVLVAPFVSSFADAAGVAYFVGEPYWGVWRARFFSNVLTELTLVPAVAIVVTAAPAWLDHASLRRQLEAALLGVGLVIAVVIGFGTSSHAIPGIPRSPIALLLPFLLWAAARFGPGGASLSLLATTLAAIGTVTHARPTREEILALQIFLAEISIPLLCLAALIEERRRAQEALRERLRFEELVSRLSGAFVHLPSHEMDQAFDEWLRRLGESIGLDRLMLLRVSGSPAVATLAHAWTAPGVQAPPPPVDLLSGDVMGWRMPLGGPSPIFRHPALGTGANGDRPAVPADTGQVIPLVAGDHILGGLAFEAGALAPAARAALVPGLQLVAEVFAGALARKEAEDALRAGEAMKAAILSSLITGVAVLDRDGAVIAVNERWTRLTRDGATWDPGIGVGSNYLEACRRAVSHGVADAGEAVVGVAQVLARSREVFTFDYASGAPPVDRWYTMTVVPLDRADGGAVVSHTDVTEARRAEVEAQHARQELAHFTRVSTMGELTASIAHELSQPLSGILTNAQAALRFLEKAPPDLGEVHAILDDIVSDDKRAGEVIQRLRDLLRKSELTRVSLDVNGLVRDVIKLLASDAVIRNVSFGLTLHPTPLMVPGDAVQLRQVILNLLLNAMDALERGAGARVIAIRSTRPSPDTAHVEVKDAGTGLPAGVERQIFEPFYTTKPAGMGMGLSIARSIVLAHGGRIWASNNPDRGATFHVALPLDSARAS